MNVIAAVDENWAIGNRNELLVRIPADHKFFREETTGKVVILGRKTLQTFPGGLPLKNRENLILSGNENFKVKDAEVFNSIEELLERLKDYDTEDVYVIGGESVYRQLLPYCDTAHITKIDRAYEADAFFPNLEDVIDTHWSEVNVQCNYLYYTPLKTDAEFYRYLKKLSELSNYHERQIELIAVDSAGRYYTEYGSMGLLPTEYIFSS